jgi:DNA-binding transcriptional LysR family regulator
MDRFAAMQAFVRVVEAGSFVRAAERLGLSTSSLSRQIADLEEHLGARLLNRTTRRLSLSESGQAFYERSVLLLADLEEAESIAGQIVATPRGTIRITCSHFFARHPIAPAIAAFVERYPQVKFDVVVSDRIVDLVEEGFDLAVRVGRIGSDQLVARKIGETELVLCGAPDYLQRHGSPAAPADLAGHVTLSYAYAPTTTWRLFDAAGAGHEVRVGGSLHANSGEMLVAAAVAGLGLVYEPDFLVRDDLQAGRLVRLMPGFAGARADIWAVYPSRRHLSVKVRLFVEHVAAAFHQAAAPPVPPPLRRGPAEAPRGVRAGRRPAR